MNMKRYYSILLVMATSLLSSGPVQALTVYFEPSPISVNVGQTFDLNLYVDASLTPDQAIMGFDINLLYEQAQVQLLSSTVGPLWDAVPSNEGANGFAGLSLVGVVGTKQLLGDFWFRCLTAGISTINVGGLDGNGGFLLADGTMVNSAPGLITTGVTVTQQEPGPGPGPGPVQAPEPGMLFLIIAGLLGLRFSNRTRS